MQYLAEVQKTQGFVGAKSALKLLARNANDNWQPVPNEQIIPTDVSITRDYKDGQLVLADIVGNNQVQSLQDATRRIITSLQSLSRVQDKYRAAEDEIEQWKQNLQYQAQELHRREQELEQRELELENLETIRQELEKAQQELLEREEQFLKQVQEFEAKGKALGEEQLRELFTLCDRLDHAINNPSAGVREALQILYERQNILTGFWHELETLRGQIQAQEDQLNAAIAQLQSKRQQWEQAQTLVVELQTEVKIQERLLQVHEQQQRFTQLQLATQEELYERMARVVESMGGSVIPDSVDPEEVKRLEAMSVEELASKVAAEQASYDRNCSFLAMQEEEEADLEGQIAELRSQIEAEKDFAKRIEMEAQLSELQEQYDSQEESLSGQRLSLQHQQTMLNLMKSILEHKQGQVSADDSLQVMTAMLEQIEDQKRQLAEELRRLEGQVNAIRSHYQKQQEQLKQHQQRQQQVWQSLQTEQEELLAKSRSLGAVASRVATQEAILRPVQDIVDALRPRLENATAYEELQQTVHQLRQFLEGLAQR